MGRLRRPLGRDDAGELVRALTREAQARPGGLIFAPDRPRPRPAWAERVLRPGRKLFLEIRCLNHHVALHTGGYVCSNVSLLECAVITFERIFKFLLITTSAITSRAFGLATGGAFITCPSPLNVLKDPYDLWLSAFR